MSNNTNNSIESYITTYLEFCEIDKNLSQNTIKMYHFYLNDFVGWIKNYTKKETVKISDLDQNIIKKYRIDLNRRISPKFNREFKKSTQRTFLVAIRAFLKYLIVEEDLKVTSPEQIILGKSEDSLPKVLNEEQLRRLFQVQDLSKRSGLRDRAILETLFSTGLRVSELVMLNIDDIDLETGEFAIIGKGKKARTVYLSQSAREWLKKYINSRNDPFKSLFVRYSGKKMDPEDYEGESLRLTARSVQRLVKKYSARAGISVDTTPHTFRHTFATGLLREGADLRSVQELLGHSSVSTTQIYTHITNKQLKDAHKKFHKDISL